jgi:hypothetical protein
MIKLYYDFGMVSFPSCGMAMVWYDLVWYEIAIHTRVWCEWLWYDIIIPHVPWYGMNGCGMTSYYMWNE